MHLANKISTLILWLPRAFNGFYFSSTSIFCLECSFCWLSRIIMPHIWCSVESGRPARWERIPSRPTFGKHIHCDWQQHFLLPEEDTGLLTTHSASTHKKKSRCCLLMLIARLRRWGERNALSPPRQCLTWWEIPVMLPQGQRKERKCSHISKEWHSVPEWKMWSGEQFYFCTNGRNVI